MNYRIIGTGSHCNVILDICLENNLNINKIIHIGEFNSNPKFKNGFIIEQMSIQELKNLKKDNHKYVMAIGDDTKRNLIYNETKKYLTYFNLISRESLISKKIKFGNSVFINRGVIINTNVSLGSNVIINTGSILDHDTIIGDNCHICPGVKIAGRVSVGSNVFIGIGATIIDGIKIGSNVIIGAGSVVLDNIPSNSKYVGSPARQVV